jgi:hypothetical protein
MRLPRPLPLRWRPPFPESVGGPWWVYLAEPSHRPMGASPQASAFSVVLPPFAIIFIRQILAGSSLGMDRIVAPQDEDIILSHVPRTADSRSSVKHCHICQLVHESHIPKVCTRAYPRALPISAAQPLASELDIWSCPRVFGQRPERHRLQPTQDRQCKLTHSSAGDHPSRQEHGRNFLMFLFLLLCRADPELRC